jgi:hypothetical protein
MDSMQALSSAFECRGGGESKGVARFGFGGGEIGPRAHMRWACGLEICSCGSRFCW